MCMSNYKYGTNKWTKYRNTYLSEWMAGKTSSNLHSPVRVRVVLQPGLTHRAFEYRSEAFYILGLYNIADVNKDTTTST